MKANIKQISELTGFSPATVSNALNNKKGVSKETAEKIFKTAREIGYLSEWHVSSIRLVVYKASGAVVNNSPFFSSLIAGVEAEGRNFGFNTQVYNLSQEDGDYDTRVEELCNDPSSALLILATELEEEEARKFKKALAPVVMLDHWYENLDFNSVLIDNVDATGQAVRYLIEKGHRTIGHLQSNYGIQNFLYRESGYRWALTEHNLEYHPEYTFLLTPSMEGAYGDMASLLQREPELPTAFFADNDMIALGAIRALQQNGYQVPGDVSVVGFDDLPFCAISNPPLTTIKVHNREMGRAAVRRLVEMAKHGADYCTKIQVRSSFVERESVRDLNQPAAPLENQ